MNKKKINMTRTERVCRTLLILLMCVGAGWGMLQIMVPKPAVADDTPLPEKTAAAAPAVKPVRPDAEQPPEPGLYDRKQDCWTFLFVGMDRGGGNTDSLMLATYDVANQTVNVASIARDTRVDTDRKLKKINAAYALSGGMDGLIEEVSRTFGIPVDYYLRVNIRGFVRLVNAVDCIDFEIPCYMNYDDPEQDLSIHYSRGMRHLNGQQALEVCRFRQNNDGTGYGDAGRQQTQRAVLTAVLKKVLANPGKINDYIAIAQENLDTNLKPSGMVWFGTKVLSFDTANLNTMAMPCEWINPYMYLDPEETLALVNEYLNPYILPRTADMLDIITR